MWIIEADGDILQGKRRWLRPGTRFIFGRTKANANAVDEIAVVDKTISRKHLVVEVETVFPEDCGNHRTRSKCTLTDWSTKIGTMLNGQSIKNPKDKKTAYTLEQETNIVTMGRYEYEFRIIWVPINFTFSFASKESKADPWTRLYKLLAPLDVKVLREYMVGVTTHLAARKRNTAKGLQALIEGKFIVNSDTYIDALVQAGTPLNDLAPLQVDFNGNFPDPLNYLPAKGDEPTQRDGAAYAPDPKRKEMFSGYTFIFYEKHQHTSLADPIFLGGGKALFKEVIPEETEVVDFVRYVKSIAGEKGLGEFEDGSEGKGVVVVRFNPVKGSGIEWYTTFGHQVSIQLDHRFIEQNEFLDAILGTNAKVLRRPLLEREQSFAQSFAGPLPSFRGSPLWTSNALTTKSYTGTENSTSMLGSSQSFATSNSAAVTSSMAPPVPAARGRRRAAVSKFKGFDEDDDISLVPSFLAPQDAMDIDPAPAPSIEPESQGLFVSQDQSQGMFVTQQSQPLALSDQDELDAIMERINSPTPSPGHNRNPRKRAAPTESESFMDQMAPAAAQAKKRKIADDRTRRRRGTASPPPKLVLPLKTREPEPVAEKPKKRVVIKPVDEDFMEKVRSKRQLLEEQAIEEREALEASLEDMDISEIRKKVQIGSIQIGRTALPPQLASRADESERWDDKWNGRKNFKKFKRRGGEKVPERVKILLKVVEAVKPDFGIGNGYWLDEEKDTKKKGKGKGKESQSQSQSRNRSQAASRLARASPDLSSDDELLEAGIMKPPTVKKPAVVAKNKVSQKAQSMVSQSTLGDKTGTKRAATTPLAKEAPVKKVKKAVLREESEEEDESDEDGLAFKYTRKKR